MELYFDDIPIQSILYGEKSEPPKRANFFGEASSFVERIESCFKDGRVEEALHVLSKLSLEGYMISKGMCETLTEVLSNLVPSYPKPLMKYDLSSLEILVKQMWNVALKIDELSTRSKVGWILFRWYEHHGYFKEARDILQELINIHSDEKDSYEKAGLLNNFAFEYFLEGKFGEAIPGFKEASKLYKAQGDSDQYANSMANYWLCIDGLGARDKIDGAEHEILELKEKLRSSPGWQARKPLILLAGIEERRGNYTKAMGFLKKAIAFGKKAGTRYAEEDARNLSALKNLVRANINN